MTPVKFLPWHYQNYFSYKSYQSYQGYKAIKAIKAILAIQAITHFLAKYLFKAYFIKYLSY